MYANGFSLQVDSTRLLSWLKGLKETHGSVEQSSLSLASSINETGVYHIGWSKENTEKVNCHNDDVSQHYPEGPLISTGYLLTRLSCI